MPSDESGVREPGGTQKPLACRCPGFGIWASRPDQRISASRRLPSKSLRKRLYEALDVLRDRFVFLRRSQFRQHVGVCEHVEAERSGERSALNAEPADVLCGRLLNAESEEVPGGEGLEVFDFLHDVQAIKKPPAVAEG